jgi:hypothetical protein
MRAAGLKGYRLDTHGEWVDMGEINIPMDNTADVVRSMRREHIPDEVIASALAMPFEEVAEAIAIDEEWQRKLGVAQAVADANLAAKGLPREALEAFQDTAKRLSRGELEALDDDAVNRLSKG